MTTYNTNKAQEVQDATTGIVVNAHPELLTTISHERQTRIDEIRSFETTKFYTSMSLFIVSFLAVLLIIVEGAIAQNPTKKFPISSWTTGCIFVMVCTIDILTATATCYTTKTRHFVVAVLASVAVAIAEGYCFFVL
jgi:hypothetical protein